MILDATFTESSADFNADFGVLSVLKTGDSVPTSIDPIFIEGAELENYYRADKADIVTGKFVGYGGNMAENSSYMCFKVKLFSGKKYRINMMTVYSWAVFENDDVSKTATHCVLIGNDRSITLPEMEDKIVTVFVSCLVSQFDKVGGNVIIVEGEDLPTGSETYKVSFPWLDLPEAKDDDPVEFGIQPYEIDEIKLKQKMPPYLLDGIEMDNYFDADYMIANAVQDTEYPKYYHTPYIYLPAGTYTVNDCYKYTPMSKDGVVGKEVLTGGVNASATFTVTEDNPYIKFMIYTKNDGVEYLRNISVQSGETATANAPATYKFNEKFDFKGSVGYYPTHWDGKKYVAIGDSITFGYAPTGNSEGLSTGQRVSTPYSKIVSENLNVALWNVGQSGANVKSALGLQQPTFNNMVQQAIDFNADLITVMLGVNDSGASTTAQYVPLGTIDDVYDENNVTFYSGLGEIVRQLQTALPNATIVLLSSPKNNFTVNQTKQDYFKAVKDVAEKYDVLFCDLHNGCGFNINNPESVSNFVLTDVHPDVKAHKVLGSRLTGFIASN